MDPDRVLIFDTTLRDGEQSPGISLNTTEKLEIAQQLARLGVDVIEAGFPIASPGDFEAVQAIAREVQGPVIAGLARAHAGRHRARVRRRSATPSALAIHTFISTSDIHIEHQLQSTREDVLGQARAAVAHAQVARRGRRVLADGRDPRRRRVHRRGDRRSRSTRARRRSTSPTPSATRCPTSTPAFLSRLYELVPALRDVVLSVHCHDDLGLAVANSFAGVQAGARQVECAINGIGERAGNASLEEIVMLLHTRARRRRPARPAIDTTRDRAHDPARLAPDRLRGAAQQGDRRPQRVRARVRHPPGRRAQGAHDLRDHGRDDASGWTPTRSCSASTPAATRCTQALEELGYEVDGQALNTAFKRFKEIADKKKQVTAMDLEALVTDELRDEIAAYTLEWFDVEASSRRPPHATVCVRTPDGEERRAATFTGDGPIDAIFRAINAATGRRRAAARVPRRRGHRRPGRARRGVASCSSSTGQSAAGQGVVDRHHRGGGHRLRARALERRAQGADRGRAAARDRAAGRARDALTAVTLDAALGASTPRRSRATSRRSCGSRASRATSARRWSASASSPGRWASRPSCTATTSRRCARTPTTRARRRRATSCSASPSRCPARARTGRGWRSTATSTSSRPARCRGRTAGRGRARSRTASSTGAGAST